VGGVHKLLVIFRLEIFRGEDHLEVAAVLRFIIIPLTQIFGLNLVLLLLSDFGFAFDGPSLKLKSFLLLELLLFEVGQV
jgi:hypothetical protein